MYSLISERGSVKQFFSPSGFKNLTLQRYEHMVWFVHSLELIVWAASKLYPACWTVIAERLAWV